MNHSSSSSVTGINSSSVGNDGLTPSQEGAIEALLSAPSVAAAARQAEVGESSLRRWLHDDDNFQNKLRCLREEALLHAALQLQQGAGKAVGTLYELIGRDKGVEPGRASLVRAAINFAFRSNVYSDVIDRLKIVENNQAAEAKQ